MQKVSAMNQNTHKFSPDQSAPINECLVIRYRQWLEAPVPQNSAVHFLQTLCPWEFVMIMLCEPEVHFKVLLL